MPASQQGGFYMVGDSVSWRADDELAGREPNWILDLRPGRRLDELPGRLDWFRANHGDPDQVIVQLGTNRRKGFNEGDFRDTMRPSRPARRCCSCCPTGSSRATTPARSRPPRSTPAGCERLAAQRPMTCLSDWPTYAATHLSNLVDGEHPDAQHEDWYARYVVRAWGDCARHLGL